METNYFLELQKVKCEVEKKNWLNYISWSDAWKELKEKHPDASYKKVKNWDTYLFRSWTWWSVECEVTVWGITHCADLAITDFRNQEIKYEAIKSTDIQNTLQRAFAKAIAMHWIGLYVYRWEGFPEEDVDTTGSDDLPTPKTKTYDTPTGGTQDKKWLNFRDLKKAIDGGIDTELLLANWIWDNGYTLSGAMKTCLRTYCDKWELIEPEWKK